MPKQGTRASHRENTRRDLIAAVRHMLLSPGTDWTARNVLLTAIAERAGLSERTLFRYFDNKTELLIAACGIQPLPQAPGTPETGTPGHPTRIPDARLTSIIVEQDPAFVGALIVHLAWGHLDLLEQASATARDVILRGRDERFNL